MFNLARCGRGPKVIRFAMLAMVLLSACVGVAQKDPATHALAPNQSVPNGLRTGAEQFHIYLPLLKGRTVAVVANQTSMVGGTHLVDTLLSLGINIKTVFAPEHGFRGEADAGQKVADGRDVRSGLHIVSLYGKNMKPTPEQLKGINFVVFDIQDVGTRFYTYISTMTYMMEACAELKISMLILDRPNPNGHFVGGPMLKKGFNSFVGMHEVPVVHGLTVAEYGAMVNTEGWLKNGVKCDLSHVAMRGYTHQTHYDLPVRPSPNLPNMRAIWLYPSLCFFEGTMVSEGRGTKLPFQQFGYPGMPGGNTTFTPISIKGVANSPKFQDKLCNGISLVNLPDSNLRGMASVNIEWLVNAYRAYTGKEPFFKEKFFDQLAGSSQLREQIVAGMSAQEIEATWQADLEKFKKTRKPYLLYP